MLDEPDDRPRDVGQRAELGRLAPERGMQRIDRRFALERAPSGQHLVEHAAEREDVGPVIDRLAADLLRRHVARRAHHGAWLRHALRRGLRAIPLQRRRAVRRQAEVEHLDVTTRRHEHVVGFEVSMNDAARVRGVKRPGDLPGVVERLPAGQRTATHGAPQRVALEQFRHGVGHTAVATEIVDGEDVGMRERGDGLRLPLEPGQSIRIDRERFRQHLERHLTPKLCIVSAVDLAHAAGAEGRDDLVGADSAATRQAHRQGL